MGGIFIAADRGYTQAQGHDERDRHGAGGDATGIKGNGKEILWHKEREGENHDIKAHQHPLQGNPKEDAQQEITRKAPTPIATAPTRTALGTLGTCSARTCRSGSDTVTITPIKS